MANEKPDLVIDDAWIDSGVLNLGGFCAVGEFSGDPTHGALRFVGVDVGQGESINWARLVYKYDDVGGSGTWKWRAEGMDEDNTGSFGSNPFGRSRTSAQVNFNEGAPTAGGTKEIDVRSIMQEIVNRGGWNRFNAMGFALTDQGSDASVYAFCDFANSYLIYRINAEPNFTPTPISVAAPALPDPDSIGIRISKPGINVLTSTSDEEMLLTTRKKQIKLFMEDTFVSTGSGTTAIPHDLGYVPATTVYALSTTPGDPWLRLPRALFSTSIQSYFIDEDNIYFYATAAGEKFYYRVFLDRIDA